MTDQPALPGPPQEPQLPEYDPRTQLVQRVRSALMVLPGFFEFGTHFEGIAGCVLHIRPDHDRAVAAQQHVRETRQPRGIIHPADVQPYPTKDMSILDVPDYDGGGNFGRLPRVVGLMTDFVAAAKTQEALGIPISDWISFLQLHSENSDPEATTEYLLEELRSGTHARSEEAAQQVLLHLGELVRLLSAGPTT